MCVVSWRGGAYLALGSEGATDEKSGLLSVAWSGLGSRLRIGSGRGSPPTYPAPSAGEPPVKGAAAPDPEGVDGRGGGAWIREAAGATEGEDGCLRREWMQTRAIAVRSIRSLAGCILHVHYRFPMDSSNAFQPDLERALREAWRSQTSSDPTGWRPSNPAWGQCAVTALIVQDELGGQLLRASTANGSHYWNRLPDGTEIDLTREQFGGAFSADDAQVREREYVLSFEATRRRYELLRDSITRSAVAA